MAASSNKVAATLWPNQIVAEMFEAAHSRGPFTVLPRTDGQFVVFDTRAPNGKGLVAGPFAKVEQAHEALERAAASEGFSMPTKAKEKAKPPTKTRERTPAKPGVAAG